MKLNLTTTLGSSTYFRKFQKQLMLISLLFGFFFANAQTIDFDARYQNNGDLFQKIQQALEEAPAGATLLFKSNNYFIDNVLPLKINKPITIQGRNPGGDFKSGNRGASGIKTIINTISNITIQSSNVKFKNIEFTRKNLGQSVYDILIDARHPSYNVEEPYNVRQIQYTGLEFNNVKLNGTAYPFHAGNGIEAEFSNVSIINYRRIGFWTDRKGRLNKSKKITFDKCYFKPESIVEFDDRAISLDAGNTEYPTVWDLENTTVRNCSFNDAGIAVSRCKNMLITGSTFNDTEGKVDMAHIEEFSSNINITRNVFNCNNARTKIIVLDRELQIVSDITINNNTINGAYAFFISAYGPNNIKVIGNNFSNAFSGNTVQQNPDSIDFTYYENRGIEPIPFEILSNNVQIYNNRGLGETKNRNVRLNLPKTGAVYRIENYLPSQKDIRRLDIPQPQIANGIYEIVNKENNQKLYPNGNLLSTKNGSGANFQWKITSNTPYTYTIQNMGTNKYLETAVGYTEFNIFNNTPENLSPYTIAYGDNEANKPYWTFFKRNGNYNIFAGGNERQSALGTNGSNVKLLFGKVGNADGTRSVANLGNNAKWTIKKVNAQPVGDNSNSATNRARTISFDNRDLLIKTGNTAPSATFGEVLPIEFTYATGRTNNVVEDLNYVAVQIRQVNENGEKVNDSEFQAVLFDEDDNQGTSSYNYEIPNTFSNGNKIPATAELPNGHQLQLLLFMSVDGDQGFANANDTIILNNGSTNTPPTNEENDSTPTTVVEKTSDIYYLQNRFTGKRVGVIDDNEGALIVQTPSNTVNTKSQWKKIDLSDGYFYLQNVSSGLNFVPFNEFSGSWLKQEASTADIAQWKIVNTNSGFFHLQNKESNMYIRPRNQDDTADTTGDNYQIHQRPTSYNGLWTQWALIPVNSGAKNVIDETALSVVVYPNPATEFISVQLSDLFTYTNATISLIDVNGAVVTTQNFTKSTEEFDVSNAAPGIYFIVIKTNERLISKKLIIE